MLNSTDLKLGPCCACRQTKPDVRNLLCLHKLAPVPGTGWGNALLGWPSNGATAVVCDACLEASAPLLDAISGYPTELGRVPVETLEGTFGHDAPDEFKLGTPGDEVGAPPTEPHYTMEDEEDGVPIVLFKMEGEHVIGATQLDDRQAEQLLGGPGLTSLSLEQTKELYGMATGQMGIGQECACVHPDRRECYVMRYKLYGKRDTDDGVCECMCHNRDDEDDYIA